jgi:hypothetical protein
MARPRIRQFADDLGISYDEAKNLIERGRSRRDGGAQILESYMRNAPTAPKKTKKKMNRSPGKGVTARREKEKLTRIPDTPYMADSEQMEILRRQSPRNPMMRRRTERNPIQRKKGGSQVGGMTVEQVMQTIEGDTKLGTKEFPLNREEQSQSRGGGKAIQGTKFTGVK